MQLSAMTEPQMGGTYDQLLALARWSEANGLVSFARSDHYHWRGEPAPDATDAFATLAGMARDTSSIRLAVLVTPITFRHPAVIAKNASTIDQMSGGRLDLGVGTGWMEAEHEALGLPFPDWSERFARLEDALGYLDAAFSKQAPGYEGEYYTLRADVRPKPEGIRLIVGGQGKKRTPSLAGRHADEYNHFLAPAPEIAPKIAVMREAAAGRQVTVSVMGAPMVGRTEAEYRQRLEKASARRHLSPEEMEEKLSNNGVPFGTPSRAAETVSALEEAGVDKWYVQWLDPADLDGFAATIEALRSG